MPHIRGKINNSSKLCGRLSTAAVSVYEYDTETYDGEYVVKPKATQQTLDTEGKRMAQDVAVLAVAQSCVANSAGGNTFTIL